jgi:hypothetical protein
LPKDGTAFGYLKIKFPTISEAKLKEGIFVGPQIRNLLLDAIFVTHLTGDSLAAWTSFKQVCEGFLGNNKDPNYKSINAC